MSPVPRRRVLSLIAAAAVIAPAAAVRAQAAKSSAPIDSEIAKLKPGQFIWEPRLSPAGPMVMVVSLKGQRAYVYRNAVRIGASTVSTGKKGHATPTGVFTILQKNKDHRSNLYNDAPMPYMQRLTWDGIALHAGNLPGYPASHGCVRLPMAFAKALFAETAMGMTVVVTDGAPDPQKLDVGDILAPVSVKGVAHAAPETQRLAKGEAFRWQPELSPSGPVSIVMSAADHRILVLRNGRLIGRARADLDTGLVAGTHALQFTGFDAGDRGKWIMIGVPGRADDNGKTLELTGAQEAAIAPEFLKAVRSVLTPGATLMVTDAALFAGDAGRKPMTVVTGEEATKAPQKTPQKAGPKAPPRAKTPQAASPQRPPTVA